MTDETDRSSELEHAIAHVYAGPLDAFVERRAAAAKELRAAGRRDDANAIKALRKPSRMAWALDAAALDASASLDGLVAAIAATLEAQSGSGDVREAFGALRLAVRAFAADAARIAADAGQRIEESALANAVLAVIGRPDDFDALRRGRLVDVPEAGGLDFLSSLPMLASPPRASIAPASPSAMPEPAPPASARKKTKSAVSAADDAAEKTARDALRRARLELEAARDRATEAQRSLDDVASNLEAAEERLRLADAEVRKLRSDRERAGQRAETAAARLKNAENSVKEAERAISGAARRA